MHPHPLGQTPGNQYNPKLSPKPIQACHSFPNIALFQTHTRKKNKNKTKEIKLNRSTKRAKSEQHRQYQSAAVFNKEECILTIRCFFFSYDLSIGEFRLQSKRKMVKKSECGEQGLYFRRMSNQSVSDGALLSLGLRSANGPGAAVAE